MRKILVKHFALGTWITIFGVTFHTLRAPRILFPLTVLTGLFIGGINPYDYTLGILDYLALANLLLFYWIGGGWFRINYFRLYPVKMEELDWEQKYDYLRGIEAGQNLINPENGLYGPFSLTDEQKKLYIRLGTRIAKIHNKRFHNVKSLLGLVISLLAIILYATLIVKI